MGKRTGRSLLATISLVGLSLGCATVRQPIAAGSDVGADPVELFRRARFAELALASDVKTVVWERRLHRARGHDGEALAELMVRDAYNSGDGASAQASLEGLSKHSTLRLLLTELLESVDQSKKLRSSVVDSDRIELALDRDALAHGYPVVEVRIAGRKLKMLWDTGATENVLDPKTVDELELVKSDVRFRIHRADSAYVARFATTGVEQFNIGAWKVRNTPWLISELTTVEGMFGATDKKLDGFLSPQLLLRDGCFAIDRSRAKLVVGFAKGSCKALIAGTQGRAPLFRVDGEVYASAKVEDSPEVAVQLETGSPITFLKADATRYLPEGMVSMSTALNRENDMVAHATGTIVSFRMAGKLDAIEAIDLQPSRKPSGHDDIASIGTDILLDGRGLVVSFASMEVGFLSNAADAVVAVAE